MAIVWGCKASVCSQVDIDVSNIIVLRVSGFISHHQALKMRHTTLLYKGPNSLSANCQVRHLLEKSAETADFQD